MKRGEIQIVLCFSVVLAVSSMVQHSRRLSLLHPVTRHRQSSLSFSVENRLPEIGTSGIQPVELFSGTRGGKAYKVEQFPVMPGGIDLNRASATLLTVIRGIGPVKAEQIIRERNMGGRFTSLEDFMWRTGVKFETLMPVRKWVHVGD